MEEVTGLPQSVFQERWVEADGLRWKYLSNYDQVGPGNPVVVLDGPTWGSRRLRDELARKCPVIALELPGFGSSPENPRARTVPDMADSTAQALAQVAPDRYTLIGTSFGANVALWQTLQGPGPVEALVLISPTSLLPNESAMAGPAGSPAERVLAHPENAACLSSSGAGFDAPALARELALIQRLGGDVHDAAAEQRLGEIQCATLVVFGSRDPMVSPRAASIYRANIPNCNVSIVYDVGHAVAAERPEALSGAVVDFVQRRETFVVGYRSSLVNP